jgi:hypothetical protein
VFEQLLSAKPDNPMVLFNAAVFYKNQGNNDRAMANLQKYFQTPYARSSDTSAALVMMNELNNIRDNKSEGNDD